MRPIKFKQPMIMKGKFYGWHYWGFIEDNMAHFVSPLPPNTGGDSFQYIGKKDHNGREVCERDIVKFAEHGYLAEIKYYPEHAAFLFDSHSPDTTNNPDALMFWSDDFEIIGNVHEHPKLMEK